MKSRTAAATILFAVFTLASCVSAEPSPVAERPILSVGDRWSRSDGVLEIVSKDADGYRARIGVKEYRLTLDGAFIETAINGITVIRYSPAFPLLSWPLRVGQTWTYTGYLTNRLTGFQGAVRESLRVEAYEDIALRVGIVKAFRVEATTSTYWYSPELRTIVRRVPKRRDSPLLEDFEIVSLPSAPSRSASRDDPAVSDSGRVGSPMRAREIAQRALPSVVLLVFGDAKGNPTGLGSGFLVQPELVVTNYHVIQGNTVGLARLANDNVDAHHKVLGVVAVNVSTDLAVIRLEGLRGPTLPLASVSAVEVGDEIYVAGNPNGLVGSFSQGIVSARREVKGKRLLQITAAIAPGSSGGPVLNGEGKVVGVVVCGGEGFNFAVDVTEVRQLMARVGPLQPISSQPAVLVKGCPVLTGD
jgi:Trypsin-like peptidase domain